MRPLFAAAGLVLLATAAQAQSSPQDFTDKAASGGLFEIQSSEAILASGVDDPEVKSFAEQMIADHTKAAADLKAAAGKAGTTVPAKPAPKEAGMLEKLDAETGDKQALYITQQRSAHEEAVALHRTYAQSGGDPSLKAYAEKALPVLEEHARHVEMLSAEKAQ